MTKSKLVLVAIWLIVVFGYLYGMQFAYDANKNYVLFLFLALAGNLVYDGLKAILEFNPRRSRDAKAVAKYGVAFFFALLASVGSLFLGAALAANQTLGERSAQIVTGIVFLSSISVATWLLAKADREFRLSNRSRGHAQ